MSVQLHITLSAELLARVDAARGPGQPRADWVRRAVEQALGDHSALLSDLTPPAPAEQLGASEQALGSSGRAGVRGRVPAPVPAEQPRDERALSEAEEPTSWEQADPGSVSFSEGVRSAAPAHPRVRSSAAARPFRPAPKKGEK